jgi:hypothetical protein
VHIPYDLLEGVSILYSRMVLGESPETDATGLKDVTSGAGEMLGRLATLLIVTKARPRGSP